MSHIAAALVTSLLLSWALETLLLAPRATAPWRRPARANALHAGLWLLEFALLLAVTRRPWFTLVLQMAQTLLILVVNQVKWRTLREPFIVQDFAYFIDMLRHPRLYLPFFGWWRALGGLVAFVAACALGFTLEPAHALDTRWLAIAAAGALLLGWGARVPAALSFEPENDHTQWGMVAAGWHYARAAQRAPEGGWPRSPFSDLAPFAGAGQRPALVMVQGESFFDARREWPGLVREDLLPNFDALRRDGVAHGPLAVPAWGANTVRTEFAALSGVPPAALGVHRFEPYRRAAYAGIATLASWLRAQGYRTVCVHPYVGAFYGRDRAMSALGFDAFVDIRSFAGAPRSGAYVSDAAVGDYVSRLVAQQREGDAPLFVFVITMENHGPLESTPVSAEDEAACYSGAPPAGCEELTHCLLHQRHTDGMLGQLRAALEAQAGPAALCFYGDHVPPLARAYGVLGHPGGSTDYLLWRKGPANLPFAIQRNPVSSSASIDCLPFSLLKAATLDAQEAAPGSIHQPTTEAAAMKDVVNISRIDGQEIISYSDEGSEPKTIGSSFFRGTSVNFNPYEKDFHRSNFLQKFLLKGWLPAGKPINQDTRITAFGSCFADNMTKHLRSVGYSLSKDRSPDIYISSMGEGLVNVHSLEQQFVWAFDNVAPPTALWHGFKAEEFGYDETIRAKTRNAFLDTDFFVITLGLSEVWYDEVTGGIFWRAVPQKDFDETRHKFRVCTFQETKDCISRMYRYIRQHVPHAKVLFTLSPIPLAATFRAQSCVTANSASKAILRAALDEFYRDNRSDLNERLFYFPSYEIISELFFVKYGPDGRHPHAEVIELIMHLFEATYCESNVSLDAIEARFKTLRLDNARRAEAYATKSG